MTSFRDYQRLSNTIKAAEELGFRVASSKWSDFGESGACLMPRDDELPMYSRDAELFTASLEEIAFFLEGIQWARRYDESMKVSNAKTRTRKEQDIRNKHLAATIKNSDNTAEQK